MCVRNQGPLSVFIEFILPKKLVFRALYEAFYRIHPAMFGQIVVMRMFREKGILTQICGKPDSGFPEGLESVE
jgi:hypothetical protein